MASTRSRPRGREHARPSSGGVAAEHATKIYTIAIVGIVVVIAFLALTSTGHVICAATQHFMLFYAGVFALITLCASVGLGLVATDRMFLHPGRRVFIQSAHRAASFGAVTFLIVHIVTEILAQRVHVLDSVVPFLSPFRTFYIGLGTIASDLIILLVITGIMRGRFNASGKAWRWRAIHYTSYASFAFGVWHGLLAGRPGKPYVDWSYGFVLAVVLLGLAVRILSNSLKPKETLSEPPVPQSAASASAPMRAAAMFAQLAASRNRQQGGLDSLTGPQQAVSTPLGAPVLTALPAGAAPAGTGQAMYEPGYEGPPRYLGAPRSTVSGPLPRLDATGPQPVFDAGSQPRYDTGSQPRYDTGSQPVYDTGSRPRYDTGSQPVYDTGSRPRYDTGSQPVYDTGSRPRYDTGSQPVYDTGPLPVYDTGPLSLYDSGAMPRVPTGPLPKADTGSMPPYASGPMPRVPSGPVRAPDQRTMPPYATGPRPRAATGPFRPADTGSFRADTGSFRADTGSFRADTGSFRADTGSFRAGDGGAYRPADSGPYDALAQDSGYPYNTGLPHDSAQRPGPRPTGPMPQAGGGYPAGRDGYPGGREGYPGGRGGRRPPAPSGPTPRDTGGYRTPAGTGPVPLGGDPRQRPARSGPPAGGRPSRPGPGDLYPGHPSWPTVGRDGSQYPDMPPWEAGVPEEDIRLRYREPGPGMPGYRGSRDQRYGGDVR